MHRRPRPPGAVDAGRSQLHSPVAWDQDLIDDVDDAVRRGHVRLHDPGVADEDLPSCDSDSDGLSVEGLGRAQLDHLRRRDLAREHVIQEDRPELRPVGAERSKRRLGHLGECRVGRSQDRERPLAPEHADEAGFLQQRRQRRELAGADGRRDDVAFLSRVRGGRRARRRDRDGRDGEEREDEA